MCDSGKLSDLFRSARGQELKTPDDPKPKKKPLYSDILKVKGIETPPPRMNYSSDGYVSFLDKYDDIGRFIDGFNPQDLAYYFREKAKEAGHKYHIANMKRDRGIYRKLLNSYSPREVALMIDFIFNSPQDYLDPASTQPTVLASNYVNTIYRDCLLWVDDKYIPTSKRKKHKLLKREWKNATPEQENTKIGEW